MAFDSLPLDNTLFFGGQMFTNRPVTNDRQVLYTLSIRAPDEAKTAVQSYTFPLSPGSIRKEYTALTAVYNTRGDPGQGGVTRTVDTWGNTPPDFMLAGTTGWQRHSADGFGLTGMQSIIALQAFFDLFAAKNQEQVQANNPNLYSLEYYDYFSGEFWQVVPVGRQGISQDAQEPLLFRYEFRWCAVRNLAAPPAVSSSDPVEDSFQTEPSQASSTITTSANNAVNAYGGQTGGAVMTTDDPALAQSLDQDPASFLTGAENFPPQFAMPGY